MTTDHHFPRQSPEARLTQASLLLLLSAAALLLLAAGRGNRVVLGCVALGAGPVPALCYAIGRWRYRSQRRRAEQAALQHLRVYLDAQASEWRQSGAPAEPVPERVRIERHFMMPPARLLAAFCDMEASIAPCVPDPVLVVFEAMLQRQRRGAVAPRLPVAVLQGEIMGRAPAAAERAASLVGQPPQHRGSGWMDAHPSMAPS